MWDRGKLTFLVFSASARRSARAASWDLRFFRRVSGTRTWFWVGTELCNVRTVCPGAIKTETIRRVKELQHIAPHSQLKAYKNSTKCL
jgi:hypothetical protein